MSATEHRLVEAATRLIAFEGGTINYTKLLKLLYIADRESLRRNHAAITGDHYVSMNAGPVLSHAYDLIKGDAKSEIWSQHVSQKQAYNVELLALPAHRTISEEDKAILDEVYSTYGHMTYGQLIDLVHTYPEWKDPGGSSITIPIRSVLRGCGYEDDAAKEISDATESIMGVHRLLGVA